MTIFKDAPSVPQSIDHLLRRAGFGISENERKKWADLSYVDAVNRLLNYTDIPDDVDAKMGGAEYLTLIASDAFDSEGILRKAEKDAFSPNSNLVDALQRWVFRMVHSERPLQEKMTLFWHNHFATGRSKIVEQLSFPGAIRSLATKQSEDPDGAIGQIELLRENAIGNFEDILIKVAQDPAMICWLDGETNKKGKPQENFARELMELYTVGVNNFTESDVHAAARVFTGWNLLPLDKDAKDVHYRGFKFYPEAHDTAPKTFSFPVYTNGVKTMPSRAKEDGFQDGLDFIAALVRHPNTGRFLAQKLYIFFVNEEHEPDPKLVEELAAVYYSSGHEIGEMLRALFLSAQFQNPKTHWSRLSWPAEYIARSIKEVGPKQFKANTAVFAMISMGQALYDPPNPSGWRTGKSWFSTSTMLARMNFAMALSWEQINQLAPEALEHTETSSQFLAYFLDKLTHRQFSDDALAHLQEYLDHGSLWSQDMNFLSNKAAGLVHLICASSEYQLV